MSKIPLECLPPVAVSDYAKCKSCTFFVSYNWTQGKWNSKTLSKAKEHVRSTGHIVQFFQQRFAQVKVREDNE